MKKLAFYGTLFMGLTLVFIGGRFLFDPLGAEIGFGIRVPVNGNYSFHYIKGIRDLFTGIAILGVLWTGERRALGVLLLAGAMVPVMDFCQVLRYPAHLPSSLIAHLVAIALAVLLGVYYFSAPVSPSSKPLTMP